MVTRQGVSVAPSKPEVNDTNAYPATFSLTEVRGAFMSQYSIYSGPGFPPISIGSGALPSFPLTNFFRLKSPEIYHLTLWPKIYKRSATNSDICERLDLPPVTVTITNAAGR
jgi:hypothetical protein